MLNQDSESEMDDRDQQRLDAMESGQFETVMDLIKVPSPAEQGRFECEGTELELEHVFDAAEPAFFSKRNENEFVNEDTEQS